MPVNEASAEYSYNLPIWSKVRDCVAGEKRIKEKGTSYLPPFAQPDQARYDAYKLRAMFYGVTQRTLSSLVGAGMRKGPEVELPSGMEYLLEDADNSGNSLNQLMRSCLHNVMAVGRHGILTDYPSAEGNLTAEDVQRLGLRPSIKEYKAETIINWREESGKLVLVVLKEKHKEQLDPFSYDERDRYRVLQLIEGVYTQSIYDDGGNMIGEAITPRDASGSTWDVIPFIFIGSMNNAPDVDNAPIYDLSVVNISHYMNSADYEESLFMFSQAMLHIDIGSMNGSTWNELNPNGIQVGARRGITTQGGGSATLIQSQANSAAYEAMVHKERQMVQIGARLVEEGGQNQTAEGVRTNAAAEHSVLSSVATNVGDAIETSIEWACMFQGANPDEVMLTMSMDFFDKSPEPQLIMAMMGLEDRGHMAPSDVVTYLRKTGLIAADRTDEQIADELSTDAGL